MRVALYQRISVATTLTVVCSASARALSADSTQKVTVSQTDDYTDHWLPTGFRIVLTETQRNQ